MQGQTHQQNFSEGGVSRGILRVAVPMLIAQLVNALYNIVDRVFVGHIPGASSMALAGIGLTFPVITIINAVASLFGSGGAPLFAMALGRDDEKDAKNILGNTFAMLILSSVVVATLLYLFKRPILRLFGASADTLPYADEYLSIYLLGTAFVMISLGMNGFINGQGFAKIGMGTVLIGAAANLILDPLLIFAFDMGVRGAALATVISQMLSAGWVLHFLTRRSALRISRSAMKLRPSLLKKITGLGLSGFIMSTTTSVVQVACNVNIQRWGGDLYLTVMTIINSIRDIVILGVSGLCSGSQPFLSYNYGARLYSRVRKSIRFVCTICVVATTAIWLVLMFLPAPFIRLFGGDDTLLQTAIPCFRTYFFGLFMMAFHFAGQSTFVALGYSKHAIFFSMLRKAVIVTPLVFILPNLLGLGVYGVFLAEPISNIVSGIACFTVMMHTVWPTLQKPDAVPPAESNEAACS